MTTLAADISATDTLLKVNAWTGAVEGGLYILDDELVILDKFGRVQASPTFPMGVDKGQWLVQSTLDPTGGVATGTTAAGSSHTHSMSGGAVSAHAVTQPSQHAAQSHASANHLPPYIVVYAWKRTA